MNNYNKDKELLLVEERNEIYCKYCGCSYVKDDGLPPECNGDCGENPYEFEYNDDFKELKF